MDKKERKTKEERRQSNKFNDILELREDQDQDSRKDDLTSD